MVKNMTKREKILAVYHNQKPDNIPISIYSRYLPRGFIEREVRNLGFGIIDYYPVVSLLAPPWHMNPGFISEVKGVDVQIKYIWQGGNMIERRTFNTPVGRVYQDVSKYIGVGSEHIGKYYITSIEDYKVMQYIVEHTIIRRNESEISSKIHDLGEDGVVLGRMDRCPYQKILIELAGAERFLIDLLTNQKPVLGLMDAMEQKMNKAFEMVLDSRVELIWQPDNTTSDLAPPDNFKKYCVPFYKKHLSQIKKADKIYIIHMDGKIKALIDLINGIDFDVIESLSLPQIGGDLTLAEAIKVFPGKVIIPNFPSNLCYQSEECIINFIKNLIEEAGEETPFMLQVSEDLPIGQWEHVLPIICKAMS